MGILLSACVHYISTVEIYGTVHVQSMSLHEISCTLTYKLTVLKHYTRYYYLISDFRGRRSKKDTPIIISEQDLPYIDKTSKGTCTWLIMHARIPVKVTLLLVVTIDSFNPIFIRLWIYVHVTQPGLNYLNPLWLNCSWQVRACVPTM